MFLEALVLLYSAKILLLLFPFKSIVKYISIKGKNNDNVDEQLLTSIKNAIARANRLSIWKNVCIVQSIAARWMLNRRNISSKLSLGVTNDKNGKVIAHAWLSVGQFEIVNKISDYLELTFFD